MSSGEWYLSADGETFNVGGYATREQALRAAVEELDLSPGDTVWTGIATEAADALSAHNVIQMLEDYANNVAPEGSDGYDISPAASEDLDVLLTAWAAKHGVKPTWYSIDEVEQHVVPEALA